LPYREEAKFYTYDTMVDYVHNVYKTNNSHVNQMFVKNLIHNETEDANKRDFYFVPSYIKYIKDKGSEYEYQKNVNKVVREKATDFTIKGIVEAEDVNDITFKQYLDKQNSNSATEAEKYAVEKYMYRKNWLVREINQEFMDKWFRKTHVLDNIKSLIEGKGIGNITTIDKFNKNNYLVYDKAKQKERVGMIEELIGSIGFDLENIGDDVVLGRETFVENMEKSIKNCKIFKDTVDCEFLFGLKSKRVKTVKAFIGFVNSILKNWGLEIGFLQKNIWNNKTQKPIKSNNYYLKYHQDINIYL
jgi:hypothetical protein